MLLGMDFIVAYFGTINTLNPRSSLNLKVIQTKTIQTVYKNVLKDL